MVDHVKGHSPKEIKSLIEVAYVAHLKVQVLSFNMDLFSSPKRLKLLIKVPNVAHLRVRAVGLNLNLVFSP